jgi:ribosome maturation factor RimP
VDHGLCKRVTDVLRDYLREYTIDVSSPGIERPVRTPQHFADAVGRRVALRTASPVDGRSKFKGEVRQAGSDTLTMSIDGTDVDIPYESIVRGNLIDER